MKLKFLYPCLNAIEKVKITVVLATRTHTLNSMATQTHPLADINHFFHSSQHKSKPREETKNLIKNFVGVNLHVLGN